MNQSVSTNGYVNLLQSNLEDMSAKNQSADRTDLLDRLDKRSPECNQTTVLWIYSLHVKYPPFIIDVLCCRSLLIFLRKPNGECGWC